MNIINEIFAKKESDRHNFILWNLSGDHNKALRQEIMQKITGNKIPKAKCGVYALEEELNKYFEKRIIELKETRNFENKKSIHYKGE